MAAKIAPTLQWWKIEALLALWETKHIDRLKPTNQKKEREDLH